MKKCKHEYFLVNEIDGLQIYLKCKEFDCEFYGEINLSTIPKTKIEWYEPDKLIPCPKCKCVGNHNE